jgi:exosortase
MTQAWKRRAKMELSGIQKRNSGRWLLFSLWIAMSLVLFARPLGWMIHFALQNNDASYVLLVPVISAWVIYLERQTVFHRLSSDIPSAVFLFLVAAFFYAQTIWSGANWSLTSNLAGYMLALVLLWISGFGLFFGRTALQAAGFSLLFLFLTVPLPEFLLNRVILVLQKGSAEITAALFDLIGVPFLREGFVFQLARINIEVTRECSGIRSSMALLILAMLVAHFRLKSTWKKALFVACGLFTMMLKNGIRIATLTLLAMYVDSSFLTGRLHRQGGIVFFLLGLLFLLPILLLLQHSEPQESPATD